MGNSVEEQNCGTRAGRPFWHRRVDDLIGNPGPFGGTARTSQLLSAQHCHDGICNVSAPDIRPVYPHGGPKRLADEFDDDAVVRSAGSHMDTGGCAIPAGMRLRGNRCGGLVAAVEKIHSCGGFGMRVGLVIRDDGRCAGGRVGHAGKATAILDLHRIGGVRIPLVRFCSLFTCGN